MTERDRAMPAPDRQRRLAPPGFDRHWDFVATPTPRWRHRQLLEALIRRSVLLPRLLEIIPVAQRAAWALFFVYCPDGELDAAQRKSLCILREQGFAICAIVASPRSGQIPGAIRSLADAVYWKPLAGYDFSAYTLGLRELARRAPAADVLVMNDSVIGPLVDVREMLAKAPWNLTGFTASGKVENHVQSYAFMLKAITPRSIGKLWPVLFPMVMCRDRDDVIACQETRFARVASRSMSVGAHWYLQDDDPTQAAPFELMAAGHPFFKKSLIAARSPFPEKERAGRFIREWIGGVPLADS